MLHHVCIPVSSGDDSGASHRFARINLQRKPETPWHLSATFPSRRCLRTSSEGACAKQSIWALLVLIWAPLILVKILFQDAREKGACLILSLVSPCWHSAPVTRQLSWVLRRQEASFPKLLINPGFSGASFIRDFHPPIHQGFLQLKGQPAGSSVTLHEDANRNIQTPLYLQSTLLVSHVSMAGWNLLKIL